ncbi:hypothetical protein MSG28_010948 [Choristoneura fumiferana]|uniref:Uncharacterized protein n=4 Tax=Choristoneura fumiferana TaxID=7141 RepID=A0ACC0KQ18_CHOFU|nr:hypothetical protein MSG28_010947 [Choristoneura fumiferana]KAI8438421.1 hypothetical protein MSG28_010948 [Choristoneura fumiferana]
MFIKRVLFLVGVISNCYAKVDLGKYLKICSRNAVDVNDCLVVAIQMGLVTMAGGLQELGVPPLDPNHEKEIRIEYKRNQIFARMSMKDIYVEGLKAAKVHDARIRADEDRFHLEVDMTTPRVFVQGNYFGEGRFNSLTFNASGMFNTTMTDLVYTWKLDGVPEKRDNETYVRIKSFYMRPDVGNLESYVSNDIPESQGIIQLANDFANANWRPLYRELLPYAQDNWNKIGIRIANKLFLKVPYDKMFPA